MHREARARSRNSDKEERTGRNRQEIRVNTRPKQDFKNDGGPTKDEQKTNGRQRQSASTGGKQSTRWMGASGGVYDAHSVRRVGRMRLSGRSCRKHQWSDSEWVGNKRKRGTIAGERVIDNLSGGDRERAGGAKRCRSD